MSGIFTVADDLDLWAAEEGAIHIKTRDPHGDPVELNEEQALELAEILTNLVKELRG